LSQRGICHAAEKGYSQHEGDEMKGQIEVREFSIGPARGAGFGRPPRPWGWSWPRQPFSSLGPGPGGKSSAPSDKSEFIVFPVAYWTPETRWAGGAAGHGRFHRKSTPQTRPRRSSFPATIRKTDNWIFTAKPEVYFGDEGFITSGNLEISRYPAISMASGPHPASSKEAYTALQTILDEQALLRIVPGRGSISAWTSSTNTIASARSLRAAIGRGGYLGAAPRHDHGNRARFPVGYSGQHLLCPQRPILASQYSFLCGPWMGSAYKFNRTKVDLREFIRCSTPIPWPSRPSSGSFRGERPFMDLPILGGDTFCGAIIRACSGQGLDPASGGIPHPVWWRFDAVAFVGVGKWPTRSRALISSPSTRRPGMDCASGSRGRAR